MIRILGVVVADGKGNTMQLEEYVADCLNYYTKDVLLEIAHKYDIDNASNKLSKSKIIDLIIERLNYMGNNELYNFLDEHEIGVTKNMINSTINNYVNFTKLCDRNFYSNADRRYISFPLYRMQDYIDMIFLLEHACPTYEMEGISVLPVRNWKDTRDINNADKC